MASYWSNSIPRTEKFLEGIELTKLISLDIFESILNKIQSKNGFTGDDIEHLIERLKLNEAKIRHVIETISFLNKQLSKVILKPSELEDVLVKDFKIENEKANLWIKLWTLDISKNFDLGNMNELENVSWELNVEAASSLFKKEKIPTVTLMLKGSKSDALLRLNEDELIHLYNNLENIQAKLDL